MKQFGGVDRRVNRGLGGHGEEIFLRVGLLSPSPSVPPSLLLLLVSLLFSLSLSLSLSFSLRLILYFFFDSFVLGIAGLDSSFLYLFLLSPRPLELTAWKSILVMRSAIHH